MTELKTLKDLGFTFEYNNKKTEDCNSCGSCSEGLQCDIRIIKSEAIKEFKLLNNHYEANRQFPFMFNNDRERKVLQSFLRWKFNLTEEDLK